MIERSYSFICDTCGEIYDCHTGDRRRATKKARELGWIPHRGKFCYCSVECFLASWGDFYDR